MENQELQHQTPASSGGEPQERPSGTEKVPGAVTGSTPAIDISAIANQLREELRREVQSEVDKRTSRLQREKPESRSAPAPTPSVPSLEEIYIQQLQGLGVPAQQIPQLVQSARAQQGVYQGQQELAQMRARQEVYEKDAYIQRRCTQLGLDPSDPDLDIGLEATVDSFERSVAGVVAKNKDKHWGQKVAELEAKVKQAEADAQAKLRDAGVFDTLSGKERVASPGQKEALLKQKREQLAKLGNSDDLQAALRLQRELVELEARE